MKTEAATLCKCCGRMEATEHDRHIGDVCAPCRHALEHVGLMLTSPVFGMKHPPRLGTPIVTFPNN